MSHRDIRRSWTAEVEEKLAYISDKSTAGVEQ